MQLDVSQTPPAEVYPWLAGLVNPRPIAWVTTLSPRGVVNLAPFSFFNAFGSNPPVLAFSPSLRPNGTKKDTLQNLEALGEFVVNVSVASLAEIINLTSKELPPEESEIELAKLHTVPSVKVQPPRVAEAPASFECKVRQIIPVGNGPGSANIVIGEIVMIHANDNVLNERGHPDPHKLQTVGRMGGMYWCRTMDLFELQRPASP